MQKNDIKKKMMVLTKQNETTKSSLATYDKKTNSLKNHYILEFTIHS